MWKLSAEFIVRPPLPQTNVCFSTKKRKCVYDVREWHILISGMLDTSQTVTPFKVRWSHNVAHNCDHATFNVDCCYNILQHLLRICMSTKASVKFHAIHNPISENLLKYFRIANWQNIYIYILWYDFYSVIPLRLNFKYQHFGTICLFHLHRRANKKRDSSKKIDSIKSG
jgi:hypothetical protein